MTQRIEHHGLQVAANLNQFIEQEALPGTGLDAASFWQGFSALVHDLAPKNRALLAERDRLQAELDAWHRAHPGPIADPAAYRKFLEDIGYLLPQPAQVRATTENVDTEISQQAGPQLVVPVSNPRYALNAANARWGSLYDALYGTDAIPATPGDDGKGYNPERGRAVIARARAFLDSAAPLAGLARRHHRLRHRPGPAARDAGRRRHDAQVAVAAHRLPGPGRRTVRHPAQEQRPAFRDPGRPRPRHRRHRCRRRQDVLLEAALTTIMDCEDSVAAVDAEDKVHIYRNWLGLMKGDLTEQVSKGGKTFTRKLNADRQYTRPDGSALTLHGRSLMFVRNVGHLMTNPPCWTAKAARFPKASWTPWSPAWPRCRIARTSSTPARARSTSSSPRCTAPSKPPSPARSSTASKTCWACRATRSRWASWTRNAAPASTSRPASRPPRRVAFINTGFLDRTGDEMHSSMEAGPMLRKGDMKSTAWIAAYERNNVLVGLDTGLRGRARSARACGPCPT